MSKAIRLMVSFAGLAIGLWACDIYLPDKGNLGKPCLDNHTCWGNLLCDPTSNTCKNGLVDGGSDAGRDGDEAGFPDGGDLPSTCVNDRACPGGNWCRNGTCVACDSGDHCGPSCIDCTLAPLNHACVMGVCGCQDDSDCPGSTCTDRICRCIPDCTNKFCGNDDDCGTKCLRCPGGLWCVPVSFVCQQCTYPHHCGTTCLDCGAGQWCANGSCAPCGADPAHCGPNCMVCGQGSFCDGSIGCVPCNLPDHCGSDCISCTEHVIQDCSCLAGDCQEGIACRNDYCAPGSTCWPVPPTGQIRCFGEGGPGDCMVGFGTAGSSTCPTTPFCGQDGQYPGLRCFSQTTDQLTMHDEITGRTWQTQNVISTQNQPEAINKCQTSQVEGWEWRLPTYQELASLINHGAPGQPFIFPGFLNVTGNADWFWWTVSGQDLNGFYAIDFKVPDIEQAQTHLYSGALCVTVASTLLVEDPTYRILTFFGGTITFDQATGLTWNSANGATGVTWQDALSICEAATDGFWADWRLPNINELQSIMAPDGSVPQRMWPPPFQYWSSTTCPGDTIGTRAWILDASNGLIQPNNKTTLPKVLCVRGGIPRPSCVD